MIDQIINFFSKKNLSSHCDFNSLFKKWDVFYVCFDEPNRNENWDQILKHVPWAQKVEGVLGFDNALKTCAKLSKTSHFFLIDGDNFILPNRLNNKVNLEGLLPDWVLSWSSQNSINSLSYGNGGLKLWPKHIALQIQSHESVDKNNDPTDYCFIAQYYLMDDFVSETRVNTTPTQAFRAGLREGVKMSLSWGKQVPLDHNNFEAQLGRQNRLRLKVWCEVGADVENGLWAILGARYGLKLNAIDRFDYSLINSYQWIENLRQDQIVKPLTLNQNPNSFNESLDGIKSIIIQLGDEINEKLPLRLKLYSQEESQMFKKSFKNPQRTGLLKPH